MKYKLINCQGFEESLLGTMLSFGRTNFDTVQLPVTDEDLKSRIEGDLAERLVKGGRGHDKFLEFIQYWIVLQAPLKLWKQIDTYGVGVRKLSESTMHCSWKNGLTQEMFSDEINEDHLKWLNKLIYRYYNEEMSVEEKEKVFNTITGNLPDAYLQTRLLIINAKCMRNMYLQRKNHKLRDWRVLCEWFKTLPHGDLITL